MRKLLCLCLLLFLCSCQQGVKLGKESFFFPTLQDRNGDMVLPLNTTSRLVTVDSRKQEAMRSAAWEVLRQYHIWADSHHFYQDENGKDIVNLATINAAYGSEKRLSVNKELFAMIKESIELAHLTDGYFNPTAGSLSCLWEPLFRSVKSIAFDPSPTEVENARQCVVEVPDLNKIIELDENTQTIRLHHYSRCSGKVQLDLGAFSKGYVSDKIYQKLLTFHSSFLFDAGTSSLISYVEKGEDIHWNVGVRQPDQQQALFALHSDNNAISTSGDDQRYFFAQQENGQLIRRHHILNPYTGYPQNDFRGITLFANAHAGVLDALSTALYNIAESTQATIVQRVANAYNTPIYRALLREEKNHTIILDIDDPLQKKMIEMKDSLPAKQINILENLYNK